MKKILVTGAAGFIGSHLTDYLLTRGWHVTAVDNFHPFYAESIKRKNLACALRNQRFQLVEADIRDMHALTQSLTGGYQAIIHLAARAGVRPSIKDPVGYLETNVMGTQNLLELARLWSTPQFIFASSSSVYGINPDTPWSEDSSPLLPISPYANTKISAELMGHVYSQLYGIRFLALRFFTVYGPRQRPDLAINKFARLMRQGKPIPLYGNGQSRRDYTFVADICAGINQAISHQGSAFEIFNLGSDRPVTLSQLVLALGDALAIRPIIEYLPEQPGDVPQTWANVEKAKQKLGYSPNTSLTCGLAQFAEWSSHNDVNSPAAMSQSNQS